MRALAACRPRSPAHGPRAITSRPWHAAQHTDGTLTPTAVHTASAAAGFSQWLHDAGAGAAWATPLPTPATLHSSRRAKAPRQSVVACGGITTPPALKLANANANVVGWLRATPHQRGRADLPPRAAKGQPGGRGFQRRNTAALLFYIAGPARSSLHGASKSRAEGMLRGWVLRIGSVAGRWVPPPSCCGAPLPAGPLVCVRLVVHLGIAPTRAELCPSNSRYIAVVRLSSVGQSVA